MKIENLDQLDLTNNFQNYMSDFTTVVKHNPPVFSLSLSFINFGQVKIGFENSTKRSPQTVCLSNRNKFDIIILWEKGIFYCNS
jgi:hypothetical protein